MHLLKFLWKKIPRPQASATIMTLMTATFIVVFDNHLFWHTLAERLGLNTFNHWFSAAVVGAGLILMTNVVFSLFSFRPMLKPFLFLILLIAAAVGYFSDFLGVVFDKNMILNILETDVGEAAEFLTGPLLSHLFFYGFAPGLLVLFARTRYRSPIREMATRLGVIFLSLLIVSALLFGNFKEIILFGRKNRDLRMFINPVYPISSLQSVLKNKYFPKKKEPLQPLANDAERKEHEPKTVLVMVVGETARAQDFFFNGYERNTNPFLKNFDVINFSNVEACGTSTNVSVPCMFSNLEHRNFSRSKAGNTENILDILQHTGVRVLWRDNNSSSKGVADRVPYENFNHLQDPEYCTKGNCYDEILLKGLKPLMASSTTDMLVVLHLKGSHGPSYYRRTPQAFKVFTPECSKDNVQDCPQEEIVNAYDNTIVYTDYFLATLVDLLQRQNFATAMLYVSDHGESLGENGLYLHGIPYALAPSEQTRVPMIFWASKKFLVDKKLDPKSLKALQQKPFSHDNIFHSLLGLFNVKTKAYNPDLDLFAAARSDVPQNHFASPATTRVTASALPGPAGHHL